MQGGPSPDCYEPRHCEDSAAALRGVDRSPPEFCLTGPARVQGRSESLRLWVPTVTRGAFHRTRLRCGSGSIMPTLAACALRARQAANGLLLDNTRRLRASALGKNG